MDLLGKKLLVVGVGNGIGKETALRCAEGGASVAGFGVNVEAGQQVIKDAAERGREGATFTYRPVDVRDRAAVKEGMASIVQEMGGLDGIIITAGTEHRAPAEELDETQMEDVFDVNTFGAIRCMVEAFPYLKENGGSVAVHSSGAGVEGHPYMSLYSAAKGALGSYVRAVAREWGKHGIRVNVICPSVETPMLDRFRGDTPEERKQTEEMFAAKTPLGGKPGHPRKAANANAFLSSDDGDFITGQHLAVDGGFTQVR